MTSACSTWGWGGRGTQKWASNSRVQDLFGTLPFIMKGIQTSPGHPPPGTLRTPSVEAALPSAPCINLSASVRAHSNSSDHSSLCSSCFYLHLPNSWQQTKRCSCEQTNITSRMPSGSSTATRVSCNNTPCSHVVLRDMVCWGDTGGRWMVGLGDLSAPSQPW